MKELVLELERDRKSLLIEEELLHQGLGVIKFWGVWVLLLKGRLYCSDILISIIVCGECVWSGLKSIDFLYVFKIDRDA